MKLPSAPPLLDAAENDGRINAQTRPTFENILKRDMAEGKAALAALTPKRKVMEDINHSTAMRDLGHAA